MGDLSEMPEDILIIEMEIRLRGGFQVADEKADSRPLERLPDLRGDDLAGESARTLRMCRRIIRYSAKINTSAPSSGITRPSIR